MKVIRSLLLILVVLLGYRTTARAEIRLLDFDDEIQPVSAELISRSIELAEQEKAEALIIRFRTSGGLISSMQQIIERIFASQVPVIVYVAPSGAQAASAGFMILISADVAAMAPGTNTGAAHPVALGLDEEKHKTLYQKAENDAAAYVRSIAEKRNRNVALAEAAVRESRSYTETEALNEHLVDLVARDLNELLQKLDGWKVKRLNGQEVILRTQGQRIVRTEPTMRERLLSFLADPNIALILAAIGLLCLYFEFNHPGAIIPAVVGGIALVLALYGFNLLPINITGVVMMLLGVGLFIAEAKVQGFGILGVGGIISLVIGSMILVDAPDPAIRIQPSIAVAVALPMAVVMYVILRLALRSRQQKVVTGDLGMVGEIGVAQTEINPEGRIFIHGELWSAVSQSRISLGERVRVVGMDGLTLRVEPVSPSAPRQASIVDAESNGKEQTQATRS
ncbi:MAG: nodulation protein NfeD [Acidobacteria bacterium]|nr:nodulation protein NfeD [Acidobacteriota bacterium]